MEKWWGWYCVEKIFLEHFVFGQWYGYNFWYFSNWFSKTHCPTCKPLLWRFFPNNGGRLLHRLQCLLLHPMRTQRHHLPVRNKHTMFSVYCDTVGNDKGIIITREARTAPWRSARTCCSSCRSWAAMGPPSRSCCNSWLGSHGSQ